MCIPHISVPGIVRISWEIVAKERVLGCGSFVRGRKRKKGDSIPFILSRRDYIPRLPDEVTW